MSSDCDRCSGLSDRVSQLEAALHESAADERWLAHNVSVEFSRIARGADIDYLYVHCEPAWGELSEEFEARYRRVRNAERSRLRRTFYGPTRGRGGVVE